MAAQWSSKDFEDQADRLVAAWHQAAAGPSLNDHVEKIARERELNPEQIQRLVAATNTRAFERKFAAMSGQPDRNVDFEVADTEAVLNRFRTATNGAAKEASYPDLPDQMRELRHPTVDLSEMVKTAATTASMLIIHDVIGKDLPIDRQYMRAEKLSEALRFRRHEAEQQYFDSLNELYQATRVVGWDHDAFEKNAIACVGFSALPELNLLRRARGEQPLPTLEKTAADRARDMLIGHETPEMRLLAKAAEGRALQEEVDRALQMHGPRMEALRKQIDALAP